jgi:hypothetical protein
MKSSVAVVMPHVLLTPASAMGTGAPRPPNPRRHPGRNRRDGASSAQKASQETPIAISAFTGENLEEVAHQRNGPGRSCPIR